MTNIICHHQTGCVVCSKNIKRFPVCKMINTVVNLWKHRCHLTWKSDLYWYVTCNVPFWHKSNMMMSSLKDSRFACGRRSKQELLYCVAYCWAEVVIGVSTWLIMFLLQELNGLCCCSEETCGWLSGCRLECKKAQVQPARIFRKFREQLQIISLFSWVPHFCQS